MGGHESPHLTSGHSCSVCHEKYSWAPRYELDWETPVQLLVATILAAQCTDEAASTKVTKNAVQEVSRRESLRQRGTFSALEEDLKPTRVSITARKAKKGAGAPCKGLVETLRRRGAEDDGGDDHALDGRRPPRPANVVLNNAFQLPTGVNRGHARPARSAQRMGLSTQKKPEKIEVDLIEPRAEERMGVSSAPAMVLQHGPVTTPVLSTQPRLPSECMFRGPLSEAGA